MKSPPSAASVLHFFKPFLKNYQGWIFWILLSLTLKIAFQATVPFLYKALIDGFVSGSASDPEALFRNGVTILWLILANYTGEIIFWQVTLHGITYFESGMMRDVGRFVFAHVQRLSYDFHVAHFAGGTVKKIIRGVGAVENLIDRVFLDFADITLKLLIISGVLFWRSWIIGSVMLVGLLLYIAVTIVLMNRQIPLERLANSLDTEVNATYIDTITNNLNVKLFAGEDREHRRIERLLTQWLKKMRRAWRYHVRIDGVQNAVIAVLEFFLLFFTLSLWKKGLFTIGDIVFVQTYLVQLLFNLSSLGRRYRDFRRGMAYAEEMVELADTRPSVQDLPKAKPLKVRHGAIEFSKITFHYESEQSLLRDFNLKIKPGEKVAIVGPSGGGKSTLVKLLFRFLDPQKGSIFIDGKDIRTVTQSSLRQHLSLVPQDPILFHRPLGENIAYAHPRATPQEIAAAARLAHIHDFIETLPKGYGMYVGERGIKLSGGERQRVAIARAILANAPIIILDEATSSLDSLSEQWIQKGLQNLMKNRTTLVIAHRLSTIMQMDRIVVIDQGRIVEEGSHADLVQRKDSLYQKLWSLQAGGFLVE